MSHPPATAHRPASAPGATAAPGITPGTGDGTGNSTGNSTGTTHGPGTSALVRQLLGLPEPVVLSTVGLARRRALERLGGPVGLVAGTAPTVAFVAVDAAAGLGPALAALGVTAVLAAGLRLARRESPGAAVAGLLVAGACAGVAALAGEARAFFLPTMALPVVFVLAYLVAFAAGRPLTGLMIGRLSGSPRDWYRHRALRRVHTVASLVGLTMAVGNLVARVALYLADEPAALAALQVVATSAFAVHFAVTLVAARRVVGTLPGAPVAVPVPAPVPVRA
ncbi:DUF3159 domain-containing protein [Cellulomonas marina]|uniref:Intracellular septation protein A n=1 Tax=Cellulomonas marina TaxID=988821 RepID=A0A1I0YCY5_9CELL|nr:DUF3159 domain-containing protein [Cellulomonas marina]GIG29615.1 hypothetical protein Cma02nite_22150 [Cellulomonas marina]SFB10248.1 Protein of unknown function [Cellulomonas marina]